MKTIPAQLLAHLQLPAITTCLLVKVECVGTYAGTVLGFTSLDIDVTYDDGEGSQLYEADNGFTPRLLAQTSTLGDGGVDSSELDGIVSSAGITEAMVRSGLFDSAKVTIYRVNYEDLTTGRHEVVAYGRAGETTYSAEGWRTEFRSLSQLLKQPISQPYSLTCRAQFGDARCGKPFVWTTGTVTSVGAENDRQFTDTSQSLTEGRVYVIEWLSGDNAANDSAGGGAQMEVDTVSSTSAGTDFDLMMGMAFAIQVGDQYRWREDCDKTLTYCRDIHANLDNMRAEPLIPVDGTAMVPGAEIKKA